MKPDKWTPERLEESANYWADRLVLEAAALDLPAQLAQGPLTADELAERLGLDARAALLFLDALAALGLLNKETGRYSNTEEAARFLVPESLDYLGHRLRAARDSWELWARLPEALRTGQRQREKTPFRDDPVAARSLLLSIHRNARSRAADILLNGSVELDDRRRMLDLGGGAGTYSVAFCRAYQELHSTLVDRPIAAAVARDVVASAGLEDRITILEYDVDEGELPASYDFIWISNVIHSRSFNANRALFERLLSRLEPGGTIAIHDLIMENDRTTPPAAAVFSLHMLLNNGVGRCYTFQEVNGWLDGAGFRDIHWIRDDEELSIVTATR
ncbi:MAG: methyltransferase domain-containing protein [Gemmatimonadetes bacterium]|uniref:Methyltransferase domain-containing protein n=1 Tax=Candidatus Kutchimonas denitrificans TaxID=3056748 RepID=A0AAE5CB32_9BACT|nr:methyltransferase domain-containing protein [Gemmatimonadota bacterium]NIR73995.1 methyltransferase domain-containing protein [Candidatus Kutchimonas denitrificans]NIS02984.1 methyltransferase domain-containing protein [Gemmatimonadota bacterium]NIT68701.1 methyltransferase domain-containing protein [Gemmatimonadota bacterium]NIU53282.1 methyltransferase domain-containing protein [Gemmatimonadota bacterium]